MTKIENGCIASKLITEKKLKVGYLYREQPSSNFNDSGWRFFAGSEDEDFCNNPDNFGIYNIETIVSNNKELKEILLMPIGTRLELNKEGKFSEL